MESQAPDRMKWLLVIGGLVAVGVVALAVAAYLALGGDDGGETARPSEGRYTNSELRYSFEYPRQWADVKDKVKPAGSENLETLDDVFVGDLDVVPDVFHGVRVTVSKAGREVGRDALEAELTALDEGLRSRAAAVQADFLEPRWVELGGLKARQYLTEFQLAGGFELASAQVVTYFGDRQYIVSCQGRSDKFDEAVLPGCEQVLHSFRFR